MEANIFVSCCSIRPEFTTIIQILRIMDYADGLGIKCSLIPRLDESLLCRARNRALADFLYKTEFTHLMTVDDDLIFPEDTIKAMLEVNKPVVGGFYRLKTDEYLGTAVRIKGSVDWRPTVIDKVLAEADYVSTGCMLVKREVIVDMINEFPAQEYVENLTGRPLWALYQPFVHFNGTFREYLSEDWAFCERAKQAGHSIWAHGGVQCAHWGKTLYTLKGIEDGRVDPGHNKAET